jgi:Tfp pilus assembly protein PilO
VTNHNIRILSSQKDDSLSFETTAKTYRYMDEDEEAAEAAKVAAAAKSRKGKRR